MSGGGDRKFFTLGAPQAEGIVPPSGVTARLTIFAAAAMSFLAVFALAFSLASTRLASSWGDALAQTSTVRVTAPDADMEVRVQAVLDILETTAGVAYARVLSAEEQRGLLAPWLGPDIDLDRLPVPQLVEVLEEDTGFDPIGLRLRLEAEVPGAVFDDHARWRAPLIAAAKRLRLLGIVAGILLICSVAVMVTLAARASLAANIRVLEVLRLVGATDRYITRAFVRRFTLRTGLGAAAGAILGFAALVSVPKSAAVAQFLPGVRFGGGDVFWVLIIPLLAAGSAYIATGAAARRMLRELQ